MKKLIRASMALVSALGVAVASSAVADPAVDAVLAWAAANQCEKYELYENYCTGVCACDFWGHCICGGDYASARVDAYTCAPPSANRCTTYSQCPVESGLLCLLYEPVPAPLSECLSACGSDGRDFR